ncbi:MAG: 2-isopropylmalate synthase [Sphingobium sp.]|jgi:2-isopropylmalate synthase|uniref:2-isopropylmalate synthase n=1 Tax=Sphingobium xenophagum TaxID=121428 RepID=A0A401J1N9_SPHXE|nr:MULTISPECIES: 2-isopropylmalate synthase [Sphingobium]MBU0658558.1 2-isopropylmalate synthase [Alphaproteobacteria bacterium]MBA4755636.1 2-isopropylmalate synthase [Sphingobium sp.]MBG6117079.1 2-isopropylmalate synthase [Sphingobium sp. JAI105]MBS87590.1 2-isopropylmalate synthase [Sphingobium sp.]MBU0774875.1 2-isopropylmalate synthase [Alphaproteobacteria bacterium]
MMLTDPSQKYRAFPQIDLPNRQWPGNVITSPPRWLSTDLRDGNQALIDPMNAEKKSRFFDLLVKVGVKEIEVGFPSAGATEFDFISALVKDGRIPDDVMVQVLTQAREDLIATTFESLRGAKKAIVHVYNAVSPAWRRIVFGMERPQIKEIAVTAAKLLRDNAAAQPDTDWHFEYSPETFSTAELDFSLECCEAVMDILMPTPDKPLILNLPATVECATPNIYADQIEWMCRHISKRDSVVISLHPHNDRGTGVAAAELGLMAGADRVEGCLFGNGERTGNCDLVTVALNMYTQGINPGLDFSDIDEVIQTVEYCNQLPVHPRHPYAGELVFTAFSGSHQDAIKKGFAAQEARNDLIWDVPYLPIDPKDLGRDYEAVIRVNSQSGKGGVAWVLQQDKGFKLPKRMQADFSRVVQGMADQSSRELNAADIWTAFQDHYHLGGEQAYRLIDYQEGGAAGDRIFTGKIAHKGGERSISGRGNGLLSSVLAALREELGVELEIADYSEHAIGSGSDVNAAAYVECRTPDGRTVFGVGTDADVATASVQAVLSAANAVARG